MLDAAPEGAVAPSAAQRAILSEKISQNRWARMQGKLGGKIAPSSFLCLVQGI